MAADTQVIIYFNNPDGQLYQVSIASYRAYWKGIGWRIPGRAPTLELDAAPVVDSQVVML